jgi:hypothetical protein
MIVDNGAPSYTPTVDGDLVAYESRIEGYFNIYVHRLSTNETLPLPRIYCYYRLRNKNRFAVLSCSTIGQRLSP